MAKVNLNPAVSQFIIILIVSMPRCYGANNQNAEQSLKTLNVKA